MAATASLTLTGYVQDAPVGAKTFTGSATSSAASMHVVSKKLASGFNQIDVPADPATSGCVIKLPAGNTQAVTLKGVTGDTGISIGKTGFHVLTWDSTSPPSSFGLTAAGTHSAATEISFF